MCGRCFEAEYDLGRDSERERVVSYLRKLADQAQTEHDEEGDEAIAWCLRSLRAGFLQAAEEIESGAH